MDWARSSLSSELRKTKIDLVKACLLVSLEEEAAIIQYRHESFASAFGEWTGEATEKLPTLATDTSNKVSSTLWNAARLDCLADQALTVFLHNLHRTDLVRTSRKQKRALKDLTEVQRQLSLHPMLFIHSVSELLYEHHGYMRMAQHGNPDSYLMSAVMEQGPGSPVILSIIFREVCRRAGLETGITILDGGTYCVLWPLNSQGEYGHQGMMLKGQHLLVDAYTGGDLILEEEVKELFDVDAMIPSSDRDILYAVLAGLRDCNWARALNRSPAPSRSSMVQCLRLAIDPQVEAEDRFALSRAIAAAERALLVKPAYCELYLDAAVLYFLEGDYTTSWHHFEMVHTCIQPWMETLGDELPAHVGADGWSENARAAYLRLEGVDPQAEAPTDHDDWMGYRDEGDEYPDGGLDGVVLLNRPEWPPSTPPGPGAVAHGQGGRMSKRSGPGWAAQHAPGAEIAQEAPAGEMQLAAGGASWLPRIAPAIKGWDDPLVLLARPVWGGLGALPTRALSAVAGSESATATGSPGGTAEHGASGGDNALGAHHIACSGSDNPPVESGSDDFWNYVGNDSSKGESDWVHDDMSCTTRAPLVLDGTIFDSRVIADMLLLRHKVGLLMRETS